MKSFNLILLFLLTLAAVERPALSSNVLCPFEGYVPPVRFAVGGYELAAADPKDVQQLVDRKFQVSPFQTFLFPFRNPYEVVDHPAMQEALRLLDGVTRDMSEPSAREREAAGGSVIRPIPGDVAAKLAELGIKAEVSFDRDGPRLELTWVNKDGRVGYSGLIGGVEPWWDRPARIPVRGNTAPPTTRGPLQPTDKVTVIFTPASGGKNGSKTLRIKDVFAGEYAPPGPPTALARMLYDGHGLTEKSPPPGPKDKGAREKRVKARLAAVEKKMAVDFDAAKKDREAIAKEEGVKEDDPTRDDKIEAVLRGKLDRADQIVRELMDEGKTKEDAEIEALRRVGLAAPIYAHRWTPKELTDALTFWQTHALADGRGVDPRLTGLNDNVTTMPHGLPRRSLAEPLAVEYREATARGAKSFLGHAATHMRGELFPMEIERKKPGTEETEKVSVLDLQGGHLYSILEEALRDTGKDGPNVRYRLTKEVEQKAGDGKTTVKGGDGTKNLKNMFVVRPDGTVQAYFEMKGPDGVWYQKRSLNTFFPQKWTLAHIEAAGRVLAKMEIDPQDTHQVDLPDGTKSRFGLFPSDPADPSSPQFTVRMIMKGDEVITIFPTGADLPTATRGDTGRGAPAK